jgi:hypothetical protein
MDGSQFVTATVDIGGYSRECSTSSSCTSSVAVVAEARKINEYSRLRTKDENARLGNLAIELQNDPTTQAYLFVYGGRRSRRGDQKKAAARAPAPTYFPVVARSPTRYPWPRFRSGSGPRRPSGPRA